MPGKLVSCRGCFGGVLALGDRDGVADATRESKMGLGCVSFMPATADWTKLGFNYRLSRESGKFFLLLSIELHSVGAA